MEKQPSISQYLILSLVFIVSIANGSCGPDNDQTLVSNTGHDLDTVSLSGGEPPRWAPLCSVSISNNSGLEWADHWNDPSYPEEQAIMAACNALPSMPDDPDHQIWRFYGSDGDYEVEQHDHSRMPSICPDCAITKGECDKCDIGHGTCAFHNSGPSTMIDVGLFAFTDGLSELFCHLLSHKLDL